METIFYKIVKMKYCNKCQGKFLADVEIKHTKYGETEYLNLKTVSCPCMNKQEKLNI